MMAMIDRTLLQARTRIGLACVAGFVATLAAAAGGCHDDEAGDPAATAAPIVPAKDALTKTTEVGPVKATEIGRAHV